MTKDPTERLREDLARIVDAEAVDAWDNLPDFANMATVRNHAISKAYWATMAKADAIQALYASLIQRLEGALTKINAIRNSIIGCQTMNWSEHIYPLVAALNDAGFQGQPYPEARAYMGSLVDQVNAAEQALSASQQEVERLSRAMTLAHDLCLSAAPKQAIGEVLASALQTEALRKTS